MRGIMTFADQLVSQAQHFFVRVFRCDAALEQRLRHSARWNGHFDADEQAAAANFDD